MDKHTEYEKYSTDFATIPGTLTRGLHCALAQLNPFVIMSSIVWTPLSERGELEICWQKEGDAQRGGACYEKGESMIPNNSN